MRNFIKKSIAVILFFVIIICFIPSIRRFTVQNELWRNRRTENENDREQDSKRLESKTTESENHYTEDNVIEETDSHFSTRNASFEDTVSPAIKNKAETDDTSFWIEFIDVGQGDSAIIQCDGHYMIIDGGPSSASSVVYTVLKNAHIDQMDYMIATHPDADHIGGLSGALNYARVTVCYSPVTVHDTKTFNNLVKYLNKQNAKLIVPAEGTSFQLGRATVELVGPIEDNADSNNNSIVTKVTYGNTSFLFMGDAEIEEENSIIAANKDLKCDVLKVAHHGSSSSTSDVFLRASAPKYAVLSVGKDNSYGHPTAETLGRLKALDISIFRTDIQGDIFCESDGKIISFSVEREAATDALWVDGASSNSTEINEGIVGSTPDKMDIPDGTTYVLNTNSKKFHVPFCGSVKDIAEKNKAYSKKSAGELVSEGYTPCGRCKPGDEDVQRNEAGDEITSSNAESKYDAKIDNQEITYILNTKSKKFHEPDCASVSEMSPQNRKEVTLSREEIVNQGYVPCKRCNP